MSDRTDKLELYQQEHGENVEHWGEYLNANFELIDTEFRGLAKELVGDELGDYEGELKSTYSSLGDRLDSIDGRVDNVSDEINSLDNDITSLMEGVSRLDSGFEVLTDVYLGSNLSNFNNGGILFNLTAASDFYLGSKSYDGGSDVFLYFEKTTSKRSFLSGSLGGKPFKFNRVTYDGSGGSYVSPLFVSYDVGTSSEIGFDITSSPHDVVVIYATHTFMTDKAYDRVSNIQWFYNYKLSKTGTSGTFSKGSRVFEYSGIDDDITSSDAFMSGLGKYAPKAGDWFYFKYTHSGDTHEFYAKVVDVGTDYIELDREFTFDSTDSAYTVERWSVLDFKQPNFLVLKTTTDHLEDFFDQLIGAHGKDYYYNVLKNFAGYYYTDGIFELVGYEYGNTDDGNEFLSAARYPSRYIVKAEDGSGSTSFDEGDAFPSTLTAVIPEYGPLSQEQPGFSLPKRVSLIYVVHRESEGSLSLGESIMVGEPLNKVVVKDLSGSNIDIATPFYSTGFYADMDSSSVVLKAEYVSTATKSPCIGGELVYRATGGGPVPYKLYPYFVIEY